MTIGTEDSLYLSHTNVFYWFFVSSKCLFMSFTQRITCIFVSIYNEDPKNFHLIYKIKSLYEVKDTLSYQWPNFCGRIIFFK